LLSQPVKVTHVQWTTSFYTQFHSTIPRKEIS